MVVADDVVRFKLRGGRKNQVAVFHAVGHDHVEANDVKIVALEIFDDLIDVGRNGDRIPVVEEEQMNRLDRLRWRRVIVDQVLACRILSLQCLIQVGHVDMLFLAGQEVVAATVKVVHAGDTADIVINNAGIGTVKHAAKSVHDGDGASHAGAVVVALHAIAAADDAVLGLAVEGGKLFDFGAFAAGDALNVFPFDGVDLFENLVCADTALVQEFVINGFVVSDQILHDTGRNPSVTTRVVLQVDVGLRANRRAVRVDRKHNTALVTHLIDKLDAVHVGDGFVEAPADVAVAIRDFIGIGTVSRTLNGTVTPDTGFRAHQAIQIAGA